ncbi:CheR family methyltransferase [Gluconacetobacter takamatsuzukensis]|uniref:protein-glutamate O-methyltransferase n=1 Tax=Gluconacetobacter takamatsuzukensis TaxID=1286190 RepID=A0A7W4KB88_9PROT|nr:protein-glutamate O-methyltransferase CheR [Gluconacetobacter takamatsuzukensis]MBB2203736.1 protein-glutamate O-methyltransferase CheR [Gluconacetobacter takamatsuzukensis]
MTDRQRVLERLAARIVARTGLHYYADKMDLLEMVLQRRMEACGCACPMDYLSRLSDESAGEAEWRALESAVTIGETFFFRYAEQFHALERTILPDLITRLRPRRTIRIWSVGCSNGAEPYSLAILLHRLLRARGELDWTVDILGTDISVQALERARAAEYGAWSLRDVGASERRQWFRPAASGRHWILRDVYRRMVRFEYGNIMDLPSGGGPAGPFDLILCRNVLLYFEATRALELVRALAERLSPPGWLLLGHSDPIGECGDFLETVTFAGTVAFRAAGSRHGPAAPRRCVLSRASGTRLSLTAPFRPARARTPDIVARADAGLARAEVRVLADRGAVAEARAGCRAALDLYPLDAGLHFLSGVLAEDAVAAGEGFRRTLYLDREHVMAHVHLARLLRDAGEEDEAERMLRQARTLLHRLPPGATVPDGDGLTVAGLLRLVGGDGAADGDETIAHGSSLLARSVS